MKGKAKGRSLGFKSCRAVTRVEPESLIHPDGQEIQEEHDEDTTDLEGQQGDEALESDGEEGEEENILAKISV